MATVTSENILIIEEMEENKAGEVFVVGTRRSARCLGKERPNYARVKEASPEKKAVTRKKPKLSFSKKDSKIPLQNSEQNGLMVPGDGCLEGEARVNESTSCSEHAAAVSNAHGGVKGSKKVPFAFKQKHYLNKGGDALLEDETRWIDPHTKAVKSAHQRVKETLRMFNTHYLQFIQEEEKRAKEVEAKISKVSKLKNGAAGREDVKRPSKRPDLKAVSKMQQNGSVLYPVKRIGHLPGIEVGDQFLSRAEMVVLGLHSHWLNGIDYMGTSFAKTKDYKDKGYVFPLAVCIVLSGMYEDDLDNSEDVVYTGQGGHDLLGSKHQIADQKMERGNLALKNSYEQRTPVRVIRGHESKNSYCGKVYTYDGLYQVINQWAEKGVSGFTVFKYKLRRVEGQPVLTTNQVFFTRAQAPQSVSELRGLVCKDISGGQENLPIPATNVIDDPPFAPNDFQYSKTIRLAKNVKLPTNVVGCKCKGECVDPRICSCARRNGGDFPYVRKDGGRLIEAKAVVFECGPGCGCSSSCVNRISQHGLKYRLEVFRTANKGWAVRSWDTIPSGAPICEYTGVLTRSDEVDTNLENNYIFDIDCLQTMKGLDGRERRPGDETLLACFDDKKSDSEFSIDAGSVGGIARFINHCCEPNLFVQCILSAHHDVKMAKVMLVAADTIPPLQELSYDYGYALDSVVGPDGNIVKLPCYCGAVGCRKRLY